MKKLILIPFFLLCCVLTKANKIDALKTTKDVETFIAALYKDKYKSSHYTFHLKKPDSVFRFSVCDSTIILESDRWQKTDFNQDGMTDLFAIVYTNDPKNSRFYYYGAYVVVAQNDNKYQLNEIPGYSLINCYSVKLIMVNNYPCLLYRHYKTEYAIDSLVGIDTTYGSYGVPESHGHYYEEGRTDTLIYKFGGFVELNTEVRKPSSIKSIYFETDRCYMFCSIFSLNIFADGEAYYVRHKSLEEKDGNFRGRINPVQKNEIIALINYLNIPDLKSNYFVTSNHMQSSKLKVFFSDGSVTEIEDYGLQGTLGLVRLYTLLFDLRLNQEWK